MSEEKKRSLMPKLSKATWFKIFLLILGIVLGAAAMHYYIEPAISTTFGEQLTSCISEKQLLNEEINKCYVDLADFQLKYPNG